MLCGEEMLMSKRILLKEVTLERSYDLLQKTNEIYFEITDKDGNIKYSNKNTPIKVISGEKTYFETPAELFIVADDFKQEEFYLGVYESDQGCRSIAEIAGNLAKVSIPVALAAPWVAGISVGLAVFSILGAQNKDDFIGHPQSISSSNSLLDNGKAAKVVEYSLKGLLAFKLFITGSN